MSDQKDGDDFDKLPSGYRSMDNLSKKIIYSDGLIISQLKQGDVIKVVTQNHTYVFTLIDPSKSVAMASSNGMHIPGPSQVRISGSFLWSGGSSIRESWIGVGYKLEVLVDGTAKKISVVKEVYLNDILILNPPDVLM
jgi:hypothetical protein